MSPTIRTLVLIICPDEFAVHALRHSYAVELYSKDKDLRAVQKQLRHVSIQSTLVYADVTDESIGNQIRGLWN